MKQLTNKGIISIPVIIVLFSMLWLFPMWRIDLRAPQYPGGLSMQIWLNDVKGDVPVINGLNHYIGMKTIHRDDFSEFVILPAAMIILAVAGIVVLFLKKKTFYYIWSGAFMLLALYSFIDFYRWEYDYGHNLDPNAPIQVPGMSYQPPLIGYKKLLNFEVLSQPDVGGWCFIAAGLLMTTICIYEWKKR